MDSEKLAELHSWLSSAAESMIFATGFDGLPFSSKYRAPLRLEPSHEAD
jgi:hypothetical protein